MPPSAAVARLAGSQRRGQRGDAVLRRAGLVPLDTGDPDFPTPDFICEAAAEAMRAGYTHYPTSQGDLDLRAALAERLNKDHGQRYNVDGILITNGAAGGVYAALTSLVNPGDQVLLLGPSFSGYEDAVRFIGAEPVWVPVQANFHLDVDALGRSINPRAKVLVLNNPCNPTAVTYTREEIEAVRDVAVHADLLVLSDEVYDHLVFDGRPYVSALDVPGLAERTILVQSFSKTFAMTGWRLGYLAGDPQLIGCAAVAQRTIHSGVNLPAQRAALAALRGLGGRWQQEMLDAYDRRRRLGYEGLAAIPRFRCAVPEATFYFWVGVTTGMSSADMVVFFERRGVAVRSGTEFGLVGEGFIRLTFATSEHDITEGIERLARAAEELPS